MTITLPDAGERFISMQIINEDEYVPAVTYDSSPHTFTKEEIGTRYMIAAFRILVDPNDPDDPDDVKQVHALQDKIRIEQPGGPGKFEIPNWDPESQGKIRAALLQLGNYVTDTRRAFGAKGEVDPVQRLIAAATTWGGNPPTDLPSTRMLPVLGRMNPAIAFSSEVLPAPFAPSRATLSPWFTWRVMPFSAITLP